MKTRAAVAFEAGKPLEVVEVDLEGPQAGEVLVEIKATGTVIPMNSPCPVPTRKGRFRPFWVMKAPASWWNAGRA